MNDRDQLADGVREAIKNNEPSAAGNRRSFLKGGLVAAAAATIPFELIGSGKAVAAELPYSPDYGPLGAVADETTGLPLLRLPGGFRYKSYGWTRDVMSDGVLTPAAHDGMAICGMDSTKLVLQRNHEVTNRNGSFAPAKITYDPVAGGGCTSLTFNPRTGQWLSSAVSIGGTINNCAGGMTPWGSWLTCEENVSGIPNGGYTKQHGWVFEVPAFGPANPQPVTGLGCFVHEATATDPVTGITYLTEDQGSSGFFRFIPNVPTRLHQGGQLQMLKVVGVNQADLRGTFPNGTTWDVEWVDIDDPTKVHFAGTDGRGVYRQGFDQGGARFARGEGAWYGPGTIWFTSTSGGATGQGQIYKYDPRAEILTMVYESPGVGVLNSPDNIAISPRGAAILCEDGGRQPQKLHGLTFDGSLFTFCENNVVLTGFKGFNGNFTGNEFAGATFHNEWLFVNIQTPGITFAITGPWDNGAL
jgi:uncharacterized protein